MQALGVMVHMMTGGSLPPLGQLLQPDESDTTALGRLKNGLLATRAEDRLTPQSVLDSSCVRNPETVDEDPLTALAKAAEAFGKLAGKRLQGIEHRIGDADNALRMLGGGSASDDQLSEVRQRDVRTQRDHKAQTLRDRDAQFQAPGVKQAYQQLLDLTAQIQASQG